MKKIYSLPLLLLVTVLFTGCSKDIFKSYDRRIEGSWELTDVTRIGFGNSSLPFTGGLFTFYGSGRLSYEDGYGGFYEGDWNIRQQNIPDCYTDEYGRSRCDNRLVYTLQVHAIDFNNHDSRSEYFDEMEFTGTNTFKAYIYDGLRTYIFKFRRR